MLVLRRVKFVFLRQLLASRSLKKNDKVSPIYDILMKLETDGLELGNWKEQCYDNAAVLFGKISGVQQRKVTLNKVTFFLTGTITPSISSSSTLQIVVTKSFPSTIGLKPPLLFSLDPRCGGKS